jgi:thiamine-monophosphate kinase
MLRNGAKPGDILAVTGFFGKSAAGLRLLLDEQCQPSHNLRDVLLGAVCMPKARLAEAFALAKSGAISASIDSQRWFSMESARNRRLSNVAF